MQTILLLIIIVLELYQNFAGQLSAENSSTVTLIVEIVWNRKLLLFAAPESLTMYCRSILDAGRSRFLCPYISQDTPQVYCGKEWDYRDVRRLAVLTDQEKEEFEKKISRNFLIKGNGVQECPKCGSLVERSDKKNIRVLCLLCSKDKSKLAYHFCWHCLREWENVSSVTKCGEISKFLVITLTNRNWLKRNN
mgnify:CR=1 FL=1